MKRFSFLSSITIRILLILFFVFLLVIALIYVVIQYQGRPQIVAMTSQAVEETGNEVINSIIANINQVDGLAQSLSAVSGSLPRENNVIDSTMQSLMNSMDDKIVGGGIWFDPNMYQQDQERQSFVWLRDANGNMQQNFSYNTEQKTPQPYYRDWWYVPAMYAQHDHCVWSRAYIDPVSKYPMMTCAKSMINSQNQAFDGVVSFNLLLDDLDQAMQQWQEKIGGYVFLVDMDNHFLTFPDTDLVTQATKTNPQGEMITVKQLVKLKPSFAPIADRLEQVNLDVINEAKQKDANRYELVANSLVSSTNLNRIDQHEANILSALLLLNVDKTTSLVDSHLVEKIKVPSDFYLGADSTAFIFQMPFTNWKMVIVEPDSQMMALANSLSKNLSLYILLGFIPILLLTAWAFRRYFTRPMRKLSTAVEKMGELIDQKKYLQLSKITLPQSNINEIRIINEKTQQLVEKVVENEGALAEVNVHLEKKVIERTTELQKAMDELKASQVQLVRSEKMATLGQMVAGVAHEVNTPLGYVRSNVELVGDNLSRYDELLNQTDKLVTLLKDQNVDPNQLQQVIDDTLTCCQEIKEDEISEDLSDLVKDSLYGVNQIAELVVSLRDFSRIDESKVKDVDMNDCIKNSLTMARNNIKTLNVHTDLAELPPVHCNPSQINQVLLNLFNNAAQAIPEGVKGVLNIKSYLEGDNVVVTVGDNGKGMSADTQAKIFEPFFTTKKAGEGTGLGLAIASQIIEKHHGSISVESQPEQGTLFKIVIPFKKQDAKNNNESNTLLFA